MPSLSSHVDRSTHVVREITSCVDTSTDTISKDKETLEGIETYESFSPREGRIQFDNTIHAWLYSV
jgi:hypothetical protein